MLKFAYRRKHLKYSLFLEGFDAISYSAAGINVNYLILLKDRESRFNRWEFGIGPGIGTILREELGVKTTFYELNGEIRYFINKNIGFMILGNCKYRLDLVKEYQEDEPWRLSTFLGMIYRW